jgi:integrase
MRYGEIAALRWDHIDFETGLIVVMESGSRLTTKSGKNRRLPMTPEVKAMLQSRGTKFDRVFRNQQDKIPNRPDSTFKRTVDKLGFNDGIVDRRQRVVFHTLRHTFASWLAIRGVPLITIRDLLGHSTISMTERYSHLAPDQGRAAIEQLPRLAGHMSGQDASPDTAQQDGAGT